MSSHRDFENYIKDFKDAFPTVCGNKIVGSQYRSPIKILSKYFLEKNNNHRVLDWGLGVGHFSHLLMSYGFDVFGYSYTLENLTPSISTLKSRFNKELKVIRSDMTDPINLPYETHFFDAVFSVGVLEHVRETGGTELGSLKELRRILKPGGKLFIFHFPNKYSWIEALTRSLNRTCNLRKNVHIYRYRRQDIKKLARQSDFKLLEMGLYNLFPRRIFCHLPNFISNSTVFCSIFYALEYSLSLILRELSQNYYAVFEKPR